MYLHLGHGGMPCPQVTAYSTSSSGPTDHSGPRGPSGPRSASGVGGPFRDSEEGASDEEAHLRAQDVMQELTEEEKEVLFFLEEELDELEDEDGADFYRHLSSEADPMLPPVADLPKFADVKPPLNHSVVHYLPSRMLVIVDVNGVHDLPVTFCSCPNAPREDVQMLDLGLYPASQARPATAFTRHLLDEFLLTNRECRASARHYYNKLRRTTDAAFPHTVPVGPGGDISSILRKLTAS